MGMANIPESTAFEIIGRKEVELILLRQQIAQLQQALMAAQDKQCDCAEMADQAGAPE